MSFCERKKNVFDAQKYAKRSRAERLRTCHKHLRKAVSTCYANAGIRPPLHLNTSFQMQTFFVTRIAARRLAEDPVIACDRPDVRTGVRRLRSPSARGSVVGLPTLHASRHARPIHVRHAATSPINLDLLALCCSASRPIIHIGTVLHRDTYLCMLFSFTAQQKSLRQY